MKYVLLLICFTATSINYSFAQSQNECLNTNNRIVVVGSLSFFAKNCILHPITDTSILNELIIDQNMKPYSISEDRFSRLTIGETYTESNYAHDFKQSEALTIKMLCDTYSQKIVSPDNEIFYYIENCKKRKFLNFKEVETFRNKKDAGAIEALSNYTLNRFESGDPMWFTSSQSPPHPLSQSRLENLKTPKEVCDQLNTQISSPFISYYDKFFYFEKCTLHPIFQMDISLMQTADEAGGIYEISTEDFLVLPEGSPWKN